MATDALPIYLDNAATTAVAPEVLGAMLPYFDKDFANASNRAHAPGRAARRAVEDAAQQLAALLHVDPAELTWTSGSTEAINLGIKGAARRHRRRGRHILTCATEHSAVLETCRALAAEGFELSVLPVDRDGRVDPGELTAELREDTTVCAVMSVNNETGVLHDLRAIAQHCAANGTLLFCDATQSVGKHDFRPDDLGIDMVAASAHKFHGPKGIGALWTRSRPTPVRLTAQTHGGSQQGGLRPGTLNVPAIVGMGAAAAWAAQRLDTAGRAAAERQRELESRLRAEIPAAYVHGAATSRSAYITSVCVPHVSAEQLLGRIGDRLALSTGSACADGDLDPSHVLLAMGVDERSAKSTVRISQGLLTTDAEIDGAVRLLAMEVAELRSESPAWELYLDGVL